MVLPEDVEEEEPEEEARPGKSDKNYIMGMIYNDCVSIEPTPKQFTVLVIKPDAVQAGKVDEIVEKVGWS